ncbi:RHS repeat-associated core domain-containing protein [uncultured Aquimarina sp.]|uniref:RHS repeat-associated core domain-containing protein n=1 Tax=uncultured Aquimarina sp. TaxID=575652 RepID=UPI002615603B|nr:RHS repeat-associated core domain-containing protein [uncultured Aquimarina sp.]
MKTIYIKTIFTLFLFILGMHVQAQDTTNLNPIDEFTYQEHTATVEKEEAVPGQNNNTHTNTKNSNSGVGKTMGDLSVSLTGGATYTVPIAVPPGINGITPDIALSYNSQGTSGIAGYGWSISGLSSITRIPATEYHDGIKDPVDFDHLDRFALDGQRLILKSGTHGGNGATYQTENYSNLKITSVGTSSYGTSYGPAYFKVQYPDGSTAYYGSTTASRSRLEYAITYMENPQGIRISYQYTTQDNVLQIANIGYGAKGNSTPSNEIQFEYQLRSLKETFYIDGIAFLRKNKLAAIKVVGNGIPFRNYRLTYTSTQRPLLDRLNQIQEFSGDDQSARTPITFSYQGSPSNGFDYSLTTSNFGVGNIEQRNAETVSLDFTGNGKMDFMVYPKTKDVFYMFQGDNFNTPMTVNSGKFVNIFPTTWLNHQDKILPGQGFTVVQNASNHKVKFKIYSKGFSSGATRPVVRYEKIWNAPTYTYRYDCAFGADIRTIKQEYISGDFNGDGLTDVVGIGKPYFNRNCSIGTPPPGEVCNTDDERIQNDRTKPSDTRNFGNCCVCTSTVNNISNVSFINLDRRITSGFSKNSGRLLQPLREDDRVISVDVNGDGKTDILHIQEGRLDVYTFNENNFLQWLWSTNSSYIKKDLPILVGDYNGDGKTEFITPKQDNSRVFYSFISTGKGFKVFTRDQLFVYKDTYQNAAEGITYGYNFIPVDLNNDGRTDIVRYRTETRNNNDNGFQSVELYYNAYGSRDSGRLRFELESRMTRTGKLKHLPVPIFLSSNRPNYGLEFATISDRWIHSYTTNATMPIIHSIHNNGVTHEIEYSGLLNQGNDLENVYASTTDQVYPYVNITTAPAIQVVSSLERKVEGVPAAFQTFYYRNAVSHLQGLGFRGFQYLSRSNWHTDASDRVFVNTTQDFGLRGAIIEEFQTPFTQRFGNIPSDYIYKTNYQYEYNISGSKVFKIWNTSSTTQNQLEGTITTSNTTHDSYNNPTKITTNYSGHGSTATEYTYTNSTGNNYYIGRPTKKTVRSTIGSQSFSTEERYSYSGALLTSLQTKGNGTQFDTEVYTYDQFGNTTKITTTPYGESSRSVEFSYDTSGRLLTKSKDVEGLETSYQYDPNTAELIKTINPYDQETGYEYDSWNRPVKVTDFLGNTTNTTYTETNHQYAVSITSNDGSASETKYDALHRMIYERSKSLDGNWSQITYEYDALDRVSGRSEPHFGNAPSQWNTIEYDRYGRVQRENHYTGKTVSYTYNGLVVAVNDGTKTVTTTRNALGNVTRVDDPGGTIRYTYFGNGNMKTSSYEGATQTIEQDGWGRKTKLTDPSAGVYSYTYNGFSEITQQTTPKGITTNSYSNTGNLISSRIKGDLTDMTTTYTYDNTTKLVTGISGNDAINRKTYQYNYQYDQYLRPKQITENNGSATFSKTYEYDTYSRVKKETYYADVSRRGSSSSVTYNYNTHGAFTGFDQWKIKKVTARGQIQQIQLGTGEEESMEYDTYGYLKKNAVYDPELNENHFEQNYSFNAVRGTLTSRSHKTSVGTYTSNYSENFEYDSQDRLTSISGPYGKTNTYDGSGRITSNSKIGDITYQGGSKRYQIKDVTLNFSGQQLLQNKARQEITYNAFKKPVDVYTQGKGRITFEYGPMGNRIHAWYGGLDQKKEDRTYHKQYATIIPAEIIHNKEDNSYKFIFFKGGDAYSAPMVTIEQMTNQGNDKADYYLQRDYLGSILNITKEAKVGTQTKGQFQEHRRFGAWGTIDAYHSEKGGWFDKSLLDRGYTGHEHFAEVGLIHMNGRMYDPEMQRFLSPDNFIQNPTNTQNYNRYSYVLNNPLMYTDPTGQMYEGDEGNGWGQGLGGSIIGGSIATVATNWDSWGMKDFFNNDFTRPFREVGRWVRGWFGGGDEPNPIIKMPQATISVDPLIAPNPSISSVFTSSGAAFDMASQGFASFNAGQLGKAIGMIQGLKTLVTNPSSLFTKEVYFGLINQGLEYAIPSYRTFNMNVEIHRASATGNINQVFHTLGGQYADFMVEATSLIPAARGAGIASTVSKSGRIFYVGEGAESLAKNLAIKTGYKTIYNTWYGALANRITPYLGKTTARSMWTFLSKVFARGVRQGDDVITIFGRHYKTKLHTLPINSRAVWKTTEFPILRDRGIDFRTILTE